MTKKEAIKLFEEKKVRTVWDDETEEWYFSVVDVVEILTDSDNPRRYWSDLKRKLSKEGSQLYANIVQLKLPSSDGKLYKTDVATTEQLFRLIQSTLLPKQSRSNSPLNAKSVLKIDNNQKEEEKKERK